MAQARKVEHTIRKRDGSLAEKNSYGNDPQPAQRLTLDSLRAPRFTDWPHSQYLFHFAAPRHPEHAAAISRVLAMPSKRFDRALITYLTTTEVDTLLVATDPTTWTGRRDRASMLLMVPNRPACLRTDRAAPQRHPSRSRSACRLPRQRPQGPLTPLAKTHHQHPARLDGRIVKQPNRSDLPNTNREITEPRRHRAQTHPTPTRRGTAVPIAERQTHHRSRPAAHRAMRLLKAGVDTAVIVLRSDTDAHRNLLHAHPEIKKKAVARTTPSAFATDHPTPCSPSSKDSDYADFGSPTTPATSDDPLA